MWYNGNVDRHIWSVSALNSITPNGKIWNESICAVSKFPPGSKENHKKQQEQIAAFRKRISAGLLIINSQHAAMTKSQKLLDSCSVGTKIFIFYKAVTEFKKETQK